jgi:hypothetical protein
MFVKQVKRVERNGIRNPVYQPRSQFEESCMVAPSNPLISLPGSLLYKYAIIIVVEVILFMLMNKCE